MNNFTTRKQYKYYAVTIAEPIYHELAKMLDAILKGAKLQKQTIDELFPELFAKVDEKYVNEIAWLMLEHDRFDDKPYLSREQMLEDKSWVWLMKSLTIIHYNKEESCEPNYRYREYCLAKSMLNFSI